MSKKALFMVHFGTTHNDTKELTIDKMNRKFADEFKDYNLFTAYTSRIVLKKLKDGKYKAYQLCVENGKDDTQTRDLYLSEYDILTEDIGRTYECDEVFADDNEEVAVLTDIDGF